MKEDGNYSNRPISNSFQVPGTTATHVIEWLTTTSPDALEAVLRMTIPNGRALRWRMVQVARKMGVLQKAADPRRVNMQGLMQRYRGTPVVEEALSKLFHERMDIEGTMDLIRDIQQGELEIFILLVVHLDYRQNLRETCCYLRGQMNNFGKD